MFAANPERPPKPHPADEPRHTTANPWHCVAARPAHSAAQMPLAPSQPFPEDSSARTPVPDGNEFQGGPATIPRRETVPELPHQFAAAQDTPAPARSEPQQPSVQVVPHASPEQLRPSLRGAANSAKPIRRMAIRFAAKFAFQLQIVLPLHRKEKARRARSHKRSAGKEPEESPEPGRAVLAGPDRTCSPQAAPPLDQSVAPADAARALALRESAGCARTPYQAQTKSRPPKRLAPRPRKGFVPRAKIPICDSEGSLRDNAPCESNRRMRPNQAHGRAAESACGS